MNAIAKKLILAVICQVVGQQHGTAGQGLEDPHVDVVPHAAVKHDTRGRIGSSHFLEIALANEGPPTVLPNQIEKAQTLPSV